ncbi:MAG: Trm112 family protein [Acidobacteriota bacterium]
METASGQTNAPLPTIDLISCVVCRVQVVLLSDRKGVQCPRCHRVYPIEDGIPQMLLEKARQPSESSLEGS